MTAFSSLKIKTKPHVKYYLEHHFGKPCRFPSGHFLGEYLSVLLSRPLKEDNHQVVNYDDQVIIELGASKFFRYGYGLTKTNRKNFNLVVEHFIKFQIRQIAEFILISSSINEDWKKRFEALQKDHKNLMEVHRNGIDKSNFRGYRKINIQINKRIHEHEQYKIRETRALEIAAYECLGFSEEILSLDAIKKDFYRYKSSVNT